MRLFKTKWFARFARQERIQDASLWEAVKRAQKGLIDADLGGHVVKQRVARAGRGRSGGYRTIIAFRAVDRAIFLYGFAKNERDNITADELATLKKIGADWLKAVAAAIEKAIDMRNLVEVTYDG
jgi:hypothetical protein